MLRKKTIKKSIALVLLVIYSSVMVVFSSFHSHHSHGVEGLFGLKEKTALIKKSTISEPSSKDCVACHFFSSHHAVTYSEITIPAPKFLEIIGSTGEVKAETYSNYSTSLFLRGPPKLVHFS